MAEVTIIKNLNNSIQENLNEFWISFSTWMEQQDIIKIFFSGRVCGV